MVPGDGDRRFVAGLHDVPLMTAAARQLTGGPCASLVGFNDADTRTHGEVLRVFGVACDPEFVRAWVAETLGPEGGGS